MGNLLSIFHKIFFYLNVYYNWFEYKKHLNLIKYQNNSTNLNVCLLLSAGSSFRFKNNNPNIKSKQLFNLNSKPLILYSIESIINTTLIDYLIIITNTKCFDEINLIIGSNLYYNKKTIKILINDIDCRLKSIQTGLDYINLNIPNLNNIIIHDSARPFVPSEYFYKIISSNTLYSHYSLKLTNGLIDEKFNVYDRNKFIEICSPICIKYSIYKFIFEKFIGYSNNYTCEPIQIFKIYNFSDINIIYGKYKYLKKITYYEDIEEHINIS